MKFLVFQHISVEHPGVFRNFMKNDGISWDTVELDEGETIPELNDYDALIVMGGPMDVWEENEHPWLVTEKQAIKHAIVDLKLPYLGFCLGHQLMADALGGKVGKMSEPEVGILDVALTTDGQASTLLSGLQKNIKSLQWHGAEVTEPPPGSLVLAESPVCAIQALQYGESAFSMQCHIELIDSTVSDWGKVPAYEQSLEKTLGPGSLEKLDAGAEKHMADFNNSAKLIYNNFITQLK
jgi:GMP synthase-like glutamine amidotransferase